MGTLPTVRLPTVRIIHGILTHDPCRTVGLLQPFFEHQGFPVSVHDYGHVQIWQIWWRNTQVVEQLAPLICDGDIVVGHSNGAVIAWRLAEEKGIRMGGAILINPALAHDAAMPDYVKWVHVYFNEGDDALGQAKALLKCPWGDQGKVGYSGQRDGYKQYPGHEENLPIVGHSAIFLKENLRVQGHKIAQRALNEVMGRLRN